MKKIFYALFLFCSITSHAEITPQNLQVTVPSEKTARLRKYQTLNDKKVLFLDTTIPAGSVLSVQLNAPLLFQWVMNDRSQVYQASFPFFNTKVLSLPDDFVIDPAEKTRIMTGTFPVLITDLNPAQVVSTLFPQTLPDGVSRVEVPLPWDAYNPTGTWAYAIQKGLNHSRNKKLITQPPRDVVDFCPRYDSLSNKEKENFWIVLLGHITDWESRYIPLTASDEGVFDSDKKGVISSGLTQISKRSSQASCYQQRGCNLIRNQDDLYDPSRNLQCAMGIMSCLSESGGCISCKSNGNWRGIAQYWSTLRTPYEVPCSICPGGKIIIGKKTEIQTALKTSAAFCF